jgi:hypothetical protein
MMEMCLPHMRLIAKAIKLKVVRKEILMVRVKVVAKDVDRFDDFKSKKDNWLWFSSGKRPEVVQDPLYPFRIDPADRYSHRNIKVDGGSVVRTLRERYHLSETFLEDLRTSPVRSTTSEPYYDEGALPWLLNRVPVLCGRGGGERRRFGKKSFTLERPDRWTPDSSRLRGQSGAQ